MNRLLPRSLGWPAALALLLTGFAVAGAVWLPQEEARLAARRTSIAQRRLALQRAPAASPAGGASDDFARSLPPDAERQARTAALLALSAEVGLPWPRSEFRYQADRELGVAQYRIAMSVVGHYGAVRHYVAEALRRDPALALESLRLRRDDRGDLKADVSWVLHMQAAP
ncbi:MAG: hypothetical protein EKK53_28020 [Burkholderiales bacterium]|nr:MAG: hypothetical protein EKK53_28020 [Burkholderiales bacterium]